MSKGPNVAALRLTAAVAQRRIRDAAKASDNIILGDHAQERMRERDLLDVDVYRVLRSGCVDEEPTAARAGEWKCKVTLKLRGSRTVGVVVIILRSRKLFVKTVEWEDLS